MLIALSVLLVFLQTRKMLSEWIKFVYINLALVPFVHFFSRVLLSWNNEFRFLFDPPLHKLLQKLNVIQSNFKIQIIIRNTLKQCWFVHLWQANIFCIKHTLVNGLRRYHIAKKKISTPQIIVVICIYIPLLLYCCRFYNNALRIELCKRKTVIQTVSRDTFEFVSSWGLITSRQIAMPGTKLCDGNFPRIKMLRDAFSQI